MPTMLVRVVTPEREVWRGEATGLVARGLEGEVGILPGHAPLLVELGIGVLRIQQGDREERAAVHGGFLHVVDGAAPRVDVLAEMAELASEIDVERARLARERAERRVEEVAGTEARADLARALTRLRLGE